MARINLLPWREEQRQQQQKEFGIIAGGAAGLVLLLIGVAHLMINGQIDYQNGRNQLLKDEIAVLDKRIKEIKDIEDEKARLLSRMEVIQQLQQSRPQIVHLMDKMIDALPEGTFLTSLKQDNDKVALDGKAQSNARVSAFMRGIERSEWLTNPALSEIVDRDRNSTGLFVFKMNLQQANPKAKEE
ncbi:MAG: PilN domain-containing protein [Gammaproteobacteria bacterium]|nr:PilN domain-containing protein [Gammaproteobacteria bacterium]